MAAGARVESLLLLLLLDAKQAACNFKVGEFMSPPRWWWIGEGEQVETGGRRTACTTADNKFYIVEYTMTDNNNTINTYLIIDGGCRIVFCLHIVWIASASEPLPWLVVAHSLWLACYQFMKILLIKCDSNTTSDWPIRRYRRHRERTHTQITAQRNVKHRSWNANCEMNE